ncbi:MAG: PQQ-binding-like beta-propeller repeat protein [Gammaproteobacteria bacterium]
MNTCILSQPEHFSSPAPGKIPVAFLLLAFSLLIATPSFSQERGTPYGEWHFQSGDAWGTRYSPLDQIDGDNFSQLETAWLWRGDNFGPQVDYINRATPLYVNGRLYTVAGSRRTVVAIDPATGETLWTFREPDTTRWERSMRTSYGKGVAYGQIDGRDVIYFTSPAFFLWALDAETGLPVENWGTPVGLESFPQTGVVDLLPDLLADWGPWLNSGIDYDPEFGIPRELGYITSSSPPIVVNGTIVVGNSAEQGYNQTRLENVPGDILGYDAGTGEYRWKFHVVPRPGEVGHETWLNNAWTYTGDVSSWAPMSADLERGIVYIPTNTVTIDYFGGFSPGDNLFSTSIIALDVRNGERLWHYQVVHSDQWNYDLPNVPLLVDLTFEGREIPALIQNTKHGFIFAFNRVTGEPIWPIEERPVPQTTVPGNWTSPTQPYPTRPEYMEPVDLTPDRVVDWTPEIRRRALEILSTFNVGGPFLPRNHAGFNGALNMACEGGVNIYHPSIIDPTTGIMYASHKPRCSGGLVQPGADVDVPDSIMTTGTTIAQWVAGRGISLPRVEGLPIFKPPYNRLSAYDMNRGERIWWIPIGEPSEQVKNHPALAGVDLTDWGGGGFGNQGGEAIHLVMGDLLVYTTEGLRGAPHLSDAGLPLLHAADKLTGEMLAEVEIPVTGQYGMMTYLHEGKQYLVVQIASSDFPGSLLALALPEG